MKSNLCACVHMCVCELCMLLYALYYMLADSCRLCRLESTQIAVLVGRMRQDAIFSILIT